jgi:predicted outer membrane protein
VVLPAVRFVRRAVLASVLVAIVVSMVLAGRSPSSPQSFSALFGGGTSATRWGPVTASDRDMLIKVRQADLWEGPSGEQAAQRATRASVREVGRKLGVEHAQLDADLRVVAEKLGVDLPSQPSDAQKVWMAEISAAAPAAYDSTFINVVRSAHGEVMPLVDGVRSGTGNELVRQFAVEASQFIDRHMGYLESTGMVNYALFPPSTAPVARLTSIGGYNVPITLVLFVIAVLVAAALLRGLSGSRPGGPPRTGGGRAGWWRYAAELGDLLRDRARRRPPPRRAGRDLGDLADPVDDSSMVSTAELIAMINPPASASTRTVPPTDTPAREWSAAPRRAGTGERRRAGTGGPRATGTGERRASVPAQRGSCGPPLRTPPKLSRSTDTRPW